MRREIHHRVRRCRIEMLALLCLPLLACLKPESTTCATGRICAPGLKCAALQDVCIETDCGDGIVQTGEVCDDGNILDGDGCSKTCKSNEECGNGETDHAVGEVCDFGDRLDGNGCSADCKSSEGCGNGRIDLDEQCDDGNLSPDDDCVDCSLATCGDGITNKTGALKEECDGKGESETCNLDCTRVRCGDLIVNRKAKEQCDDGNLDSEDDCVECRVARCGDGFSHLKGAHLEQCDFFNHPETCNNNCTMSECGDGILNKLTEQCDDGNRTNNDACPNSCLIPICGNGAVEGLEACDDGNNLACGTCDATCTRTQAPRVARGQIIPVKGKSIVDGETFTISDGTMGLTFKFKKGAENDAGSDSAIPIPIKDYDTEAEVADAIAEAINENGPDSQSSPPLQINAFFVKSKPRVLLENVTPGAHGNTALAESIEDEGFKVEGMEGGSGGGCAEATGCTQDDDCMEGMQCRAMKCTKRDVHN